MALKEFRDLPVDTDLSGTEIFPLQEAAGGAGSTKESTLTTLAAFILGEAPLSLSPKASPIAADRCVILDSASGDVLKIAEIGNFPGGGGGYQPTRTIYVDGAISVDVPGEKYATFQAAAAWWITNGSADWVTFKVAKGTYTGANVDFMSAGFEPHIRIEGSGAEGTFLNFAVYVQQLVPDTFSVIQGIHIAAFDANSGMGAGYLRIESSMIDTLGGNTNIEGFPGAVIQDSAIGTFQFNNVTCDIVRSTVATCTMLSTGASATINLHEIHALDVNCNGKAVVANIYPDCTGITFSNDGSATKNWIPADQDGNVGTKTVDEAAIADGRIPTYRTSSGALEYEEAGPQAFTAGTSGDWATAPPSTLQDALDRMASLLVTLNSSNPIP